MNANEPKHQFASDNYAGVCPEAWDAMRRANEGHAQAYGEDEWTQRATDLLRDLFETDCEVFFTFNGTAANSLALASLCQSYHSILCHEAAHLETDECGGPEFFSNGTKVLLVGGHNAKVDHADIERMVTRRKDIHYPKPRALSLTQSTELGTVYSVDELAAACETARRLNLHVHMDGARFANSCVSLDAAPKDITWKLGVDVLCFGGTKNGMAVGDAVIFFNHDLAVEFDYRCKQAGQLASKMRFLAAPWVGMIESGAWLSNARQGNRTAALLAQRIEAVPGVRVQYPVEANAVFVSMPEPIGAALRAAGYHYYTFIGESARFMTCWDTTDHDVHQLVDCMKAAVT
jgi:threonine aldolase